MRYRLTCGIVMAMVCLAAACTPSPSAQPPSPPASDPEPSSPQAISASVAERPDDRETKNSAIVAALEREVTCDFHETPLGQAAKFLESELGFEIEIDTRALDEVGLDASSPVSLKIRDISGAAALHHLLQSIDGTLTYTVEDDVLTITTRVAAEEHLQTVLYPVADLTVPLDLDEVIAIDKYFKGFNEDRQLDRLIDVIAQTIEPDSWSDVGGPGEAVARGTTLVVSQTWEIQRKIHRLLAALRATRDAQTIQPVPDARTAAIEQALDTKIDADFADVPLGDVASALSERTGTQILLQQAALDPFGIDGNVAVTLDVKGIPLRSALRLILAGIDPALVLDVHHEALMITTRETSEADLQVFVYPVGHLVERSTKNAATNRADYDALIDVIRSTIDPDSWDHVGGAGSIVAFSPCRCLVVSQTYEMQRRVKQLLAKLPSADKAIAGEGSPAAQQAAPPADPYRTAIYYLQRPEPAGSDEAPRDEGNVDAIVTPTNEASPDNGTAEEDRIAKAVRSAVDPASWQNVEASIESLPGQLVIRQRESIHNQILGLLKSLELLGARSQFGFFGGVEAEFDGSGAIFGGGFGGGFGDFGDGQESGPPQGSDSFTEPMPAGAAESLKPPASKPPALPKPSNDPGDDPFGGDPFSGDPFSGDPIGENPFGPDPDSADQANPPGNHQPASQKRRQEVPEAVSLALRDWFARANHYFKSLDAEQEPKARLILASTYASRGRLARVKAMMAQCTDPQHRKECAIISVLEFLFATGNAKRAIEFANGLDEPAERDAALRTIAAKQADFHRFNQAIKTAKMIEDRQEANYAWHGIAIDQARAGKFAAARRSIDAMTILTDDDRVSRADIRDTIRDRQASGEIAEPQVPGETWRDKNDRKLQALKTISVEELAEAEAGLDELETADERTETLHGLGVAYFQKGDRDRANQFADKALASARTIEGRLQRILRFAYLADLMLQLGRQDDARALAQEAYKIGREKPPTEEADPDAEAEQIVEDLFFNMFADTARGPLLAVVLLETGDADGAFAIAEDEGDKIGTNTMLWVTIGKWYAEKNQLDELVRRLESVKSAEARFYLCIGVIEPLIATERRSKSNTAP